MFFGALGAGSMPYFASIPESQMDTVGALGGGLLVGTALAVIVPEGFHAFAAAHAHEGHEGHHHEHAHGEGPAEGLAGLVLVGGFLAMLLIDHMQHSAGGSHAHAHGHARGHGHAHGHGHACGGKPDQQQQQQPELASAQGASAPSAKPKPKQKQDKGGGAASPPAAGSGGGSGKDAGSGGGGSGSANPESAVLGLIIHCVADGLAMGVAALSGNARLSALIGVAMVLHKVPMGFGLGTYLLSCKWAWRRAQRVLVAFAATAPAATLVTYLLLGALPFFASPLAVSLALLFSGGTFLYAATMHILPEILSLGSGRLGAAQLAAVCAGALAPVLLSWGHSH
eukprot:scaffold1.g5296.t1